jgi:hypothetical protein
MSGSGWTILLIALASPAAAQIPVDFGTVETARSRDCVGILNQVEVLDAQLAPFVDRSQRLLAIGQVVALEEREAMDSLRISDPLEARVHAWFVADGELAQRYIAAPDSSILVQRSIAKDSVEAALGRELEALQAQADSVIATTGTLGQEAGNCSGAVFIRPAVLESCQATVSGLCDAARDSVLVPGFRFVESADVLWGIQELRAWTAPTALQVTPTGQLGGARTVGFTRASNVVVTVAFGPRLRRRTDLTIAEAARSAALTDSLGFGSTHPEVVFTPSLAIQASLPSALGGESRYILHFGPPEQADILWAGEAGTGADIEGVVDLGPNRLEKLMASEQLMLTALRPSDTGDEPVFSIELSSLNQGPASSALVGYMNAQLGADLAQILPTEPPPAAAPR